MGGWVAVYSELALGCFPLACPALGVQAPNKDPDRRNYAGLLLRNLKLGSRDNRQCFLLRRMPATQRFRFQHSGDLGFQGS